SELIPLPSEDTEVIQPTLWEDESGVHLLLRSKNKRIYRSDSTDGIHWGTAYPLDIPHNNSGLDLVKTPEKLVLCCNPVTEGRTPLCLLTSEDGIRFENALTLESSPGEYSYPAVIWDGEKIRGTYTWKREKIVYFEAQF
ncbi:MAG: exo-alpha-sialidase, partial [Eubacteriales bacterium]